MMGTHGVPMPGSWKNSTFSCLDIGPACSTSVQNSTGDNAMVYTCSHSQQSMATVPS